MSLLSSLAHLFRNTFGNQGFVGWDIFGGSIRGPAHLQENSPNQDAWHAENTPESLLAVVCNGMGSAKYADEGSKAACQSLSGAFAIWKRKKDAPVEMLIRLLHDIWAIETYPREKRECASTCLFVLLYEGRCICCQLGDGMILVKTKGEGIVFLEEEKSNSFGNRTTGLGIAKNLQEWKSKEFPLEQIKGILLATDGVSEDLEQERRDLVLNDLVKTYQKIPPQKRENKLIEELKLFRILEEWLNPDELKNKADHRIKSRFFELVAETGMFDEDSILESQVQIEETKGVMEKLLRNNLANQKSELYRNIAPHQKVNIPNALKQTNLLTHHKHYRYLPELWKALVQVNPTLTEKQWREKQLSLVQQFAEFVWLLLLRTLESEKFLICDPLEGNDSYRLHSKKWDMTLRVSRDQERLLSYLECETNGGPALCIVPIASEVPVMTRVVSNRLVVVYSSNPKQPLLKKGMISASPMDFYSLERMGQSIFQWLLEIKETTYPPMLDLTNLPTEVRKNLTQQSFLEKQYSDDRNYSYLLLSGDNSSKNKVENILAEFSSKQTESITRWKKDQGKETHKQNKGLRGEGMESEEALKKIDTWRKAWNQSIQEWDSLLFCPVCGEKGGLFEPREEFCFEYTCHNNCESVWGKKRKKNTQLRLFIHLKNREEENQDSNNGKSLQRVGRYFLLEGENHEREK